MRGKPHPPEIRAKAVAEMVTGEPVSNVCERYGIPERTAFDWLEDARKSQWVRSNRGLSREVQREELVDLVEQLVIESVKTLSAQARVAGREHWVEKQTARDLAEYRGTEFDRIIRLLAAFRPAAPADDERQPPVASSAVHIDG